MTAIGFFIRASLLLLASPSTSEIASFSPLPLASLSCSSAHLFLLRHVVAEAEGQRRGTSFQYHMRVMVTEDNQLPDTRF